MKTILVFFLFSIPYCFTPNTPREYVPAAAAESEPVADSIDFSTQIQPILQNKCSPCHFPGGKMYEKLPFDRAKTILDHPEGMLKRISEGEEGRLIRAFLGR